MYPSKVLDLGSFENNAALQAYTIAHFDVGTNNNIRTNAAILSDLGCRVNHHIALVHVVQHWVGKRFRLFLCKMAQIQACASQEVLGLTDIHPETFQIKGMQLTILRDEWKDFLFNRGWFQLE